MELLKHFAPVFGDNQMKEKSLIFENEKYLKVPNKYKMLIGIGIIAALRSDTCTQMWTKLEYKMELQ
jgi:alkylhydroperoxidase/carboxymuconolactone decarboxylase family protein YurZ